MTFHKDFQKDKKNKKNNFMKKERDIMKEDFVQKALIKYLELKN